MSSLLSQLWGGLFAASDTADDGYKPLTEDEARDLPLVPHYDYAVMSEHVYLDGTSRQLPKGWRVFLHCSELKLNREGFGAVAYINHEIRHVVIAKRGTIDAAGLRTGIWVYFDEPTVQFTLAEQFSKVVRLKLQLEGHDYTVSYTGHSLGGVLATCRAVAEQTYAIVFETPGCKGFVEKTMHPFRYDEADILVYLRPPNTINTLKPQVGFVVQLPPREVVPVSRDAADENAQRKIAQMLPSLPFANYNDVAGFMGKKILERSVPELYEYLSKMEPVVRDLFNETQQVHSIHNIVPLFEDEKGQYTEPEGSELVSIWPNHLMQFFEFHSVQKSLEECRADEPHLRLAFEELQKKIYRTRKRERHQIPLTWLSPDSLSLISWWEKLGVRERRDPKLPLTRTDRRVLSSCWIGRENVKSVGISGFQLKQYAGILSKAPAVRDFIGTLPKFDAPAAKL